MKPPVTESESVPLAGALDDAADPTQESPRPADMKFLYATGDQPLDGYTIKRGVGRGGFGEVYFATSDAGKEVALKLIRRNLDVELRGVRHCLNLKHTNLIGLYDIRADGVDDQWVVMEYVNGDSLEEVIDSHPHGMPVDAVLWWIRSIAAGVGYLHDHGIVHRDLKPGNIFLDRDGSSPGQPGTVKIGDYGLSKFISCSRRSGQTESVGTVHYMAPEIANGRYGREIDTYALGVILYEMLTGHVPFEGESVGEVLMKHLTAEPKLDALAEPFQEIVRRALAKDPELRLSSVGEMVALLPGAGGASPALDDHTAEPPRTFRPPPESIDSGEHERFAGYDYDERRHRSSRHPALPRATAPRVEEPIYGGLRRFFTGMRRGFHDPDVAPPVKALAVIAMVMITVALNFALLPIAVVLLLMYAVYYLFWALLVRPGAPPAPAAGGFYGPSDQRPTIAGQPLSPHTAGRQTRPKPWREVVRTQLVQQPARHRVTELLGSLLVASIGCVLASVLLAGLIDSPAGHGVLALWMTVVTTAGAWGVLIVNKLTEARVEDQAPKRSCMLLAGIVVGLLAFAATHTLLLDLPADHDFGPPPVDTFLGKLGDSQWGMMDGWRESAVRPGVVVSVVYFALLFTVPRWWRLAEFTRDKRLSVWSIIGLMIGAWLLHLAWWYPQPIGVMVAGVVAAAVQLASPWFPPSKRAELARQRAAI